jgi:hypothetical protein
MYGRVVRYKLKPEKLAEIDSVIESSRAKLAKVAGVVVSCSMWNEDGTAFTFSLWDSAAAAEAALPALKDIWDPVGPYLASPPEVQGFTNAIKLAG